MKHDIIMFGEGHLFEIFGVRMNTDKDVRGFTQIIAPVRRSRPQRVVAMRARQGEGGDVSG